MPGDLARLQCRAHSLVLASDLLPSQQMFTRTQPESASLLSTPGCVCLPHLTFGERTRHTEKRLPALFDASGAVSPMGSVPRPGLDAATTSESDSEGKEHLGG